LIRPATQADAVQISRLLLTSLKQGVEGNFRIDKVKLGQHVMQTIGSLNGFAQVDAVDGEVQACFMGELVPHAYCKGYIATQLGVYIQPSKRGGKVFTDLLDNFIEWAGQKPDVLFKEFSIGQIGPTTPYLRAMLKRRGFTKQIEGYAQICRN
jgi:hypothetical protein